MSKYYTKIWYESNEEFEKLRHEILNDKTNNKTEDFTTEKLVIENHDGFMAIFLRNTHEPVCICGLHKISNYSGVGRLMNRTYVWPKFRDTGRKKVFENIKNLTEHIIKPLYRSSPYHTHILSMANRKERNNFFNTFYLLHDKAWPNHWHRVEGYVQTGQGMTKNCWQNIITDNPNYKFKTLNHDQWLLLPD